MHRRASPRDRDQVEAQFFWDATKPWSQLPGELKGVRSSREKLNRILFREISGGLKSFIKDIRTWIDLCEEYLRNLGEPRPTNQQQRLFLSGVTSKLQNLIDQGIGCDYGDAFFNVSDVETAVRKRILNKIRALSDQFAEEMSSNGLLYKYLLREKENGYCSTHGRVSLDQEFVLQPRRESTCMSLKHYTAAISTYIAMN